jgi:hypothetical protein
MSSFFDHLLKFNAKSPLVFPYETDYDSYGQAIGDVFQLNRREEINNPSIRTHGKQD